MDAEILTVIGIVVGAALTAGGSAAGIWAARRYGSHRGRLEIDVRNVQIVGRARLVRVDSGDDEHPEYVTEVESNHDGPAAFVVQVRIRNRGLRDISDEAYGGRPLMLYLGGKKTKATGTVSFFGVPFIPPPEPGVSSIDIGPVRIPSKAEWGCALIVQGATPRVSVHSPLRDVDVKVKTHKPRTAGPGIFFDLPALYGYKKPRNLFGFGGRVHPY